MYNMFTVLIRLIYRMNRAILSYVSIREVDIAGTLRETVLTLY